ncbi:MAG: hypothetical protein RQ751_05775, partial [Longimicrobiales bacterium]|nr:hypothetical protein [Longimicrobiales bacterium]
GDRFEVALCERDEELGHDAQAVGDRLLVEDGEAGVELAERGRLHARVRGGLAEGEVVILYPSSELEDWVRARGGAG